jgi:hypothetical protein
LASRAIAPNRAGSIASMRPRSSVARGGRRPTGRHGNDDIVAVDDRGQDEIAERRPVGDIDRHAGHPGGALGVGVRVEVAGGNEDGRRPPKIIGRNRLDLIDRSTRRARETCPTLGRGPAAHDDDATSLEIEEERQVPHDTSTRSATLRARMPRPWATANSQSEPWDIRGLPIGLFDLATHRISARSGFAEGPGRLGKSFCAGPDAGNFSLFGLF